MKLLLRAAMTAVSIGSIPPAIAGEGHGAYPNALCIEYPGVFARAPIQGAPFADPVLLASSTAAHIRHQSSAFQLHVGAAYHA